MRILALLLSAVVLLGCTSNPKQRPPIVVEVPVVKPCINQMPEMPDYETQYLQASDSLCVITKALLVERLQRIIYVEQLKAAMSGCMIGEQTK